MNVQWKFQVQTPSLPSSVSFLCLYVLSLLCLPSQVFLWIGNGANKEEKEAAISTAQEYLLTHPGGRDVETTIVLVKQGFEPPTFTGWFKAWDPCMWSVCTVVIICLTARLII